jgi:hypothetical protein
MEMILPVMVLVMSLALCFFYAQIACQTILNREFRREYFRSVVNASSLEFLLVRKQVEEASGQIDYAGARRALTCDYLALTYLLRNAAGAGRKYSNQERLLMVYFRGLLLFLTAAHLLKLNERRAILNLTAILQYFANVLGERVVETALAGSSV